MVIDSSAVIAVLRGESEAETFQQAIAAATFRAMSAASLLETKIVAANLGVSEELDSWLAAAEIEIVAFTPGHCDLAEQAYLRFGKGRHPAGLNFGDCFAYALAKTAAEPLLYKGEDFSKTDIPPAV